MDYVHCPFCGARVAVAADGSVEPKCPRCGAWALARGGALSGGGDEILGATAAVETRSVESPSGSVSFVRTPYSGEVPGGLED